MHFGSPTRRLVGLATVVLVVGVLWVAQTVLMPLALGMVLAFLLTPIVRLFERLRFPRPLAVVSTLGLALSLLVSAAWMGAHQIAELAEQAPTYISTIHDKLTTDAPASRTLAQIDRTMERLSAELDTSTEERERARPVRVMAERFSPLDGIRNAVELVLAPAATFAMVLVLVAFMLGRREDVRDRIIRMIGLDNVTVTTRLIDETFQGVSRFLLTQSLLNAAVGALVAVGMWILGVPYPALFGVAMALLRFVPYLGALSVTALASVIAFAGTPGWTTALATFALCLALDVAFAYIVEPVVMSRRVGVSSLALLVSAVFWTWIWGAVGLAVATPLTLCLAALGRHLPGLELLDVVLGDTRPLTTDVSYYQRLLARDAEEARSIVTREREEIGDARLVDEVIVPALLALARDHEAYTIADDDVAFADVTTSAILGELEPQPEPCAAPFDVIAVGEGAAALDATLRFASGGQARTVAPERLHAEVVDELERTRPSMVCIATLSVAASTVARLLCRKIRAKVPDIDIVMFCPAEDPTRGFERRARESGATAVCTRVGDVIARVVATPTHSEPITPHAGAARRGPRRGWRSRARLGAHTRRSLR